MSYVSLHTHSSFSMLDGLSQRKDLIARCKEWSVPALCCSEHGNVFQAPSFVRDCTMAGIKPIVGCEFYIAPDDHKNREYSDPHGSGDDGLGDISKTAYHITMLAKNREGYRNIQQLSTLSYREGFYYKPRVSLQLLNQYHKGIIALSGCLGSISSQLIVAGHKDKALEYINRLRAIFGEDFYLELMSHGIPEEKMVSDALIDIGKIHGIPLVVTNDSHYTNQDDKDVHDIALCIGTNKTVHDEKRFRFNGDGYWFKSPQEMWETTCAAGFPQEAFTNTVMIAKQIDEYGIKYIGKQRAKDDSGKPCGIIDMMEAVYKREFPKDQYPDYIAPTVPVFKDRFGKVWPAEECHDLLRTATYQGLASHGVMNVLSGKPDISKDQRYIDRLEFELTTIKNKNFSSYFLIIADIVRFMYEDLGILSPAGRGSSVGSLVCYTMKITAFDPVEFNVPFYRFINEGRKDLPDIDTDISQRHRGKVIDYIVKVYGKEHVAHIITFNTMLAKAAVKSSGKALGIPNGMSAEVAKALGEPSKDDHLKDLLETNSKARGLMETVPNWIRYATRLEGNHSNVSVHAAGITISNEPIEECVALHRDVDGVYTIQVDMQDLAAIGLLKLDMLGLKTLDLIEDTIIAVYERMKKNGSRVSMPKPGLIVDDITGKVVADFYRIPLEDKPTLDLVASGNFVSLFQYDSHGIREMARQLAPDKFSHLMALNALYRPGPMLRPTRKDPETGQDIETGEASIAEHYIARRHGKESIVVWHDELEPIFRHTFGMPIFQEQISEMAKVYAGFDDTGADEFRAAIGKKSAAGFAAASAKFKSYAISKKQRDPTQVDEIIARLEGFARYCWNVGHSLAYSYLSYVTAYFETHYRLEYFAALLNSQLDKPEKLKKALAAILQQGITISPPHVNHSGPYFESRDGIIYMGLLSIKQLGQAALTEIVRIRDQDGPFQSFIDFMLRMKGVTPVNKIVKENLVYAKAFAWDKSLTDKDKIGLVEPIKKALDRKPKMGLSHHTILDLLMCGYQLTRENFSHRDHQEHERRVLNFYVSGHPVMEYQKMVPYILGDAQVVLTPSQLKEADEEIIGQRGMVLGSLTKREMKTSKNGKPYVLLTLSDQFDSIQLYVWPPLGTNIWEKLVDNCVIMATGTLKPDFRGEGIMLEPYSCVMIDNGIPLKGVLSMSDSAGSVAEDILGVKCLYDKAIRTHVGTVTPFDRQGFLKPSHVDRLATTRGISFLINQ